MPEDNETSTIYYCYLMRADQFVKIGYTQDLAKRLEQIQTGNPHPVEIIASFVHQTETGARMMESTFHHKFRRHHIRGEWFRVRPVLKYFAKRAKEDVERWEKQKGNYQASKLK